ncbi:MAG: hypothetical protein HY782_29025 [Chloroflexi bacterium]|nr:hypothetical protein [Chloroflexota bacterium]
MDSPSDPSLRLAPHARIAVVGGGPAGSLFALSALQFAAQLDRPLDITIFERKDLRTAGPSGCNMCAGILSHRVVKGLAQLDLALPEDLILSRVRAYRLYWQANSFTIWPPDPARQVLSVYRGGGPRKSARASIVGFDQYLLNEARTRGARVVAERVQRVSFDSWPRVYTATLQENFDLVVLAIGANATPPLFERLAYDPPIAERMAQDELLLASEQSRAQMNGTVHVYFDEPSDLIFGALVPKGDFANVSLLGRHLRRNSLAEFLRLPQVAAIVGDQAPQVCGCRPCVAVSPARDYYADRFVAIGDSCVTRLYKDGIGSALATARAAAETALVHGIGRQHFAAHYAPVCRAIAADNRFGRLVFALVAHSKRNAVFMRALGRALETEAAAPPPSRVLSQTFWALFTGDASYADILRMLFKPKAIARLGKAVAQEFGS